MNLHNGIVKIQNNQRHNTRSNFTGQKIRSHVILFPHDAPKIASTALILCNQITNPNEEQLDLLLDDLIQFDLNFVCPNNEMDFTMQQTMNTTTLAARSYVLYQWLSCLQFLILTIERISTCLNQKLKERGFQLSDKQSLRFENVLGDDVAQQATHVHDSTNQCCINYHCTSDEEIPSGYYYVHSQQDYDEKSKQSK